MNPITSAIMNGATYVGRGFSGNIKQLVRLIKGAIEHPGFAVIDVFSPCVTFNRDNTYDFFRQRVAPLEDEGHDPSDWKSACERAMEWDDRIYTGLFYQDQAVQSLHALEPILDGGAPPVSHVSEAITQEQRDRIVRADDVGGRPLLAAHRAGVSRAAGASPNAGLPRAELALAVVVLAWAASLSIVKFGVGLGDPYAFNLARLLPASVVLLFAVSRTPALRRFEWRDAGQVFLLGVAGHVVFQVGFIHGTDASSATSSALILGLTPVAIAVLAWVTRVEPLLPAHRSRPRAHDGGDRRSSPGRNRA